MVACFGLTADNHLPRVPADHLVENRNRIDAFHLLRIGALAPGAATRLAWDGAPVGCRLSSDGCVLWIEAGTRKCQVVIAWDAPMPWIHRAWFLCPTCSRRCRHLYFDELVCRCCCALRYSVRHQRVTPILHRIARLRRLIAADRQPFAPLPPRPQRGGTRYDRFVARLAIEEQELLDHLSGINNDLARRIRSRKAKGGKYWKK